MPADSSLRTEGSRSSNASDSPDGMWLLLVISVTAFVGVNAEGEHPQSRLEKELGGVDLEEVREKLHEIESNVEAKHEELSESDKLIVDEALKEVKKRREHYNKDIPIEAESIPSINEKGNIIEDLYQGDILLTNEQAEYLAAVSEQGNRSKRQASKPSTFPRNIWKSYLPIPYVLDSSLTENGKVMVRQGVEFWEKNTCVTFKESSSSTSGSGIKFIYGSGCSSYVGRNLDNKLQDISIGVNCDTIRGTTHEIAHALGVFHMQGRYDRDSYVIVNNANIQEGAAANFVKESQSTTDNYGLPYDYGSAMHYGERSFVIKGVEGATLVSRNSAYQNVMGSGREPSFYDVLLINKFYNCSEGCEAYASYCKNGGYPMKKNCAQCICPSGFGGATCAERSNKFGCGQTVTATSSYQTLKSQVGNGVWGAVNNFTECVYWIQAPAGKKIQVSLVNILDVCTDSCFYGAVEMKLQSDLLNTGQRFCCSSDNGKVLTSANNLLPIIVFNRFYYSGFEIKYKYV